MGKDMPRYFLFYFSWVKPCCFPLIVIDVPISQTEQQRSCKQCCLPIDLGILPHGTEMGSCVSWGWVHSCGHSLNWSIPNW